MLEEILSDDNIERAIKHVVGKKSCAGEDLITYKDVEHIWKEDKQLIVNSIQRKCYIPMCFKRIYIKKENSNNKRVITIPSQIDRVIQYAAAEILNKKYDDKFSDNNYGYRKGRAALDAVKRCLQYMNAGYDYILKMDIEDFFDNVDHEILMKEIKMDIDDDRVVELLESYVKYTLIVKDNIIVNKRGIPQGAPLSPLMANIYLNIIDKKLDEKNIKYIRYVDDIIFFFDNDREPEIVKNYVNHILKTETKLNINETKTAIIEGEKVFYMGYGFAQDMFGKYTVRTREEIIENMLNRMKKHIFAKDITLDKLWDKLGAFNRGWINYYKYIPEDDILDILEVITKKQSEMIMEKLDNIFVNNELSFEDLKWSVLNSKEYVSMPIWYKQVKEKIDN